GIVDDDVVDVSNLQRQVIHTTDRIGVPKVDSAEEQIKALNPDVEVVKYKLRLDASNIMEVIDGYDVVVDGADNFPTRYLLNDALAATTTELKVRRDPECPICSREPDAISDEEMGVFPDYEAFCAAAG